MLYGLRVGDLISRSVRFNLQHSSPVFFAFFGSSFTTPCAELKMLKFAYVVPDFLTTEPKALQNFMFKIHN